MTYRVNVTVRAERDLALLFDAINAGNSAAALSWYKGLKEAILSLEEQANRCPETPENRRLRHLLYGRKPHIYRVIYRVSVKNRQVDVLHIRHGARQRFRRPDVR
jgi:toxin ParE1/3/4